MPTTPEDLKARRKIAVLKEMESRLEKFADRLEDAEKQGIRQLMSKIESYNVTGLRVMRTFTPFYGMTFLGDGFLLCQIVRLNIGRFRRQSRSRDGNRGSFASLCCYLFTCLACADVCIGVFGWLFALFALLGGAFVEPFLMLIGVLCCCGLRRRRQQGSWTTHVQIRWKVQRKDHISPDRVKFIKFDKNNNSAESLSFKVPALMEFMHGLDEIEESQPSV